MPVAIETPSVPSFARWLNGHTGGRSAPDFVLSFHGWLYRSSGGRLGHGLIGAPTLLLTTRGRRSQQPRTTALVYARDGDRFLVAASNDGADRDPHWLLNLRAHPEVTLQVSRHRLRATARVMDADDPNRPRLWRLMNAANHGRYELYQARTRRLIPLVLLEPTHPAGPIEALAPLREPPTIDEHR